MNTRLALQGWMVVGFCVHLAGCVTCPRHAEALPAPPPAPRSEVHFEGLIAKAQTLLLPPASFTLRQALAEVGGFLSENKQVHPEDCLVGFHRAKDEEDTTYYFPLAAVLQDSAGSVLLKHGDKIKIVSWQETLLTDRAGFNLIKTQLDALQPVDTPDKLKQRNLLLSKLPPRKFVVHGPVPNSGTTQTAEKTEKIVERIKFTDPEWFVKISRMTDKKYREVFYLPVVKERYDRDVNGRTVAGYNSEMLAKQLIYPDDVYDITTFAEEALILGGMLTRLIYDSATTVQTQAAPSHPRLANFWRRTIPPLLRPNIRRPQSQLPAEMPALDSIAR